MWWWSQAALSWVEPGRGSEIQASSPSVQEATWWLWPVVWCLPEMELARFDGQVRCVDYAACRSAL
jgi:hypothetical protein